jgi:hypothetical protein
VGITLLALCFLALVPMLCSLAVRSIPAVANEGVKDESATAFARLPGASGLQVAPESLQISQMVGDVITRAMMLTNTGTTSIDYELTTAQFTTLRIVSGSNWRVSDVYTPGWEARNFNDSAWGCTVAPAPVNCDYEHCWDDPDVFTMWSEEQYTSIYLRKLFYIPDVSSVLSATITTRCDDDHDLYINGILVASDWDGLAGPILVTDITEDLHTGLNVIAVLASDTHGGCRHMCVDAVIHFAATTPDWLTLAPEAGTLPGNTSTSISITLDATHLRPGVYPAALNVLSNDLLNPMIAVPVTLMVTAPIQNRYLPMSFKE